MVDSRAQPAGSYQPIRAARGLALSCKGWQQEAALRMFMNSLDPAVAERPAELMVSAGTGKLVRDWPAFHAIVNSLQEIANDETVAIRSGELGPILKTNLDAPRVVILNSSSPQQETHFQIDRAASPDTARIAADWMFTGPSSALPETYEIFRAAARKHFDGSFAGRLVVAGGMGGMGGAQALAATLNGAAFLGIDADRERIKRCVKSGFCEVMVNDLDEALRILKNAVRKGAPTSVGLIANTGELLPELVRRGVLPDLLTDQTPADDPLAYIPPGLTIAQAAALREQDPRAYGEKALDAVAAQVRAMLELKRMGSIVFEFGNGIRAQALARGVIDANMIPDFASQYLQADLTQRGGLLTVVALSGDQDDLARVDSLFPALFPDSELQKWMAIARKLPSPGLPARSCRMKADEAVRLGLAINDLIARGDIKAPMAMGRTVRHDRASRAPAASRLDTIADWPELSGLLHAGAGASWLALGINAPADSILRQEVSWALVADGKPETAARIKRVFADDFAAAISCLPPPAPR